MQTNIGIQVTGRIMHAGGTFGEMDIRHHTHFGFSFLVTADLAADAVFNVEAAMVDPADNCSAGAYAPVNEISICDRPEVPGLATFTIPAGTVAGTCIAGTIPCRSGAFIRLADGGNTADVEVVGLLKGPTMTGGASQDAYS